MRLQKQAPLQNLLQSGCSEQKKMPEGVCQSSTATPTTVF
jgi:hypothetical protein